MAKSNIPYIGFKTSDNWTAENLITLVQSVSEIYKILAACQFRSDYDRRFSEHLRNRLKKYDKLYDRYLNHPLYQDLFHMWRDYLREWTKRGTSSYFPPLLFPLPFDSQRTEEQLPHTSEILEKIHSYLNDEGELHLYKMKMSSPGGISFKGLGPVIREFRELIKDLWFRNKQEKDRGQLELIDKYLCMQKEYPEANLSPPSMLLTERKLIEAVDEHINEIKRLEKEGKLLSVPENMDHLPE
jgi:hypothetical protein